MATMSAVRDQELDLKDPVTLILLSAKVGKLNQLFVEMLGELPHKQLALSKEFFSNTDKDSIEKLTSKLKDNEILVTNDNYRQDETSFMVLNNKSPIILYVEGVNGEVINGHTQDEYDSAENKIVQDLAIIYKVMQRSSCLYTCTLDE